MFGPSIEKIEKWGQKGKVSRLEKVIARSNVEFRNAAFKALGKSGNEEAINLIIHYIRHPEAECRKLAAEALGDSGAPRTLEFLRKLSKEDEDKDVREAANKAIIKINKVVAHAE